MKSYLLKKRMVIVLHCFFAGSIGFLLSAQEGFRGYYQYPAIHSEMIFFSAEGDIWKVPLKGGVAQRLTTHPGEESNPRISPDGKTLAFTATYEGPSEVYTMPVEGGLPQRWTYEADASIVSGWTPEGDLVYTSRAYSSLPDWQTLKINLKTREISRYPLSQASEASLSSDGRTIYFVRPAYHGNVTKRYMGGTARKIWKYTEGSAEAVQLSDEYKGESHHPMCWNNRLYFITDRDGIMNIWSMTDDGKDYRQHTQQKDFDVRYATLYNGKIAYQVGADIWLYDLSADREQKLDISLSSDMDQMREKWVKDPQQYITSVHAHPEGDKIVITARGRVFVAPRGDGRLVQLSRKEGVRYRDAVFSADGKDIITLSDESGEFEFMQIPANGIGPHKALTDDGKILRFRAYPAPDGSKIAYSDLNNDLWLLDQATKKQKLISTNREGIRGVAWSPDSRWIAFSQTADNTFAQILLYGLAEGKHIEITTDRANSTNPVWSPDGKWIYFISDRNFQSLVGSPWGTRQPEPYFDRKEKIYQVSIPGSLRSPFKPDDELYKPEKDENDKKEVSVVVDPDNIKERITELPLDPGNYSSLAVNKEAVYFVSGTGSGRDSKRNLMALKIENKGKPALSIVEGVSSVEMTSDGKMFLIGKDRNYYLIKAGTSAVSKLNDDKIDLSAWAFKIDTREDWRQLFTDAWRMERDYFYDPDMHNVDWDAMYLKYLPLVDRITSREELSDLIGRYVGELSVLHTSVRGGDVRRGSDNISVPSLGARFVRDQKAGGFRIDYIYKSDPDYPDELSPLADPVLNVSEGDILTHINGDPVLEEIHPGALLRNQSGKQVHLKLLSGTNNKAYELVVETMARESGLRYNDWEYSRRLEVEEKGEGKIGYVHLRAMGSNDIAQWYKDFYPVFDRQGLIIDVRHNNGGNIDSFILEKLLRKAWFYWQYRNKKPAWNMQYAFRGHIVVLCDQNTASDGEAFCDGFRRLGLGKTIGMRTWGGEVWLGSQNTLSDNGLARAPMNGVYGPEGEWLIEGVGFIPDIEVDNLPHQTFRGTDAQLNAAIEHLQDLIREDPREVPDPPKHPDKSFNNKK